MFALDLWKRGGKTIRRACIKRKRGTGKFPKTKRKKTGADSILKRRKDGENAPMEKTQLASENTGRRTLEKPNSIFFQ